jgi:hypothetical protein
MKIDISSASRITQSLCPTKSLGLPTSGLVSLRVADGKAFVSCKGLESSATVSVPVEDPFDLSVWMSPAPFRSGPVTIKSMNDSHTKLMVTGDGMKSILTVLPNHDRDDASGKEMAETIIPHGELSNLADSIRWVAQACGSQAGLEAVLFRGKDIAASDGKSLNWVSSPDVGTFTCPAKVAVSIADALDAADSDVSVGCADNKIYVRADNLSYWSFGTTTFKEVIRMGRTLLASTGISHVFDAKLLINSLRRCLEINGGYASLYRESGDDRFFLKTENSGTSSEIDVEIDSFEPHEFNTICAFDPSKLLSAIQPFSDGKVKLICDPSPSAGTKIIKIESTDTAHPCTALVAQMTTR